VRAEAGGERPTGRELKLTPTPFTKDGTFLDHLVECGPIAVAAKPTPPERGREGEPAQFRTRYKLTKKGRHAAVYGEYQQDYNPVPTGGQSPGPPMLGYTWNSKSGRTASP